MRRAWTMWVFLAACAPPELAEVPATFAPGGAFFDAPFPADARRDSEGRPNWRPFPNPSGLTLFDSFLDRASAMPGVGMNAPIYVRFDDAIDTRILPTPEASLREDSPVQLINITPESASFGERTPIRWEFRPDAGAYVPGNLLAIAPVAGWPLDAGTTYALVVTDAASARVPSWDALGEDGASGPWADTYALLQAALPSVGLDPARVTLGTTFTTTDPLVELDAIARFLDERVEPASFTPTLDFTYTLANYDLYRTDYATPRFMSGDKPYADAGGAFVYRDDGLPQIEGFDLMRVAVTVPTSAAMPEDGWPVVVYLHGTGGDYRNFANGDGSFEPARWIAEMGAVGIGIDLPLHGPRGPAGTQIELHSFNVLQPDSALYMHRQAAADLMYLVKSLTDDALTFARVDDTPVALDPDRVAIIGHSQGGITAALALPWLGDRVQGVMLSGTGGLLAITAVEREATVDFPTLIKSLLEFADDEELTELHPVLGLIQTLVEPTDPINYASAWFHEDRGLHGASPVPVLLTTGLDDAQTPTRTSEALAAAARMPFAGKVRTDAPGLTLRGFGATSLPLSDQVEAYDGSRVTAGFSQWRNADHFVIFRDERARDLTAHFLATALQGAPKLSTRTPPSAND